MKSIELIVACPVCGTILDGPTHATRRRVYFDCFKCNVQVILRDRKKADQILESQVVTL